MVGLRIGRGTFRLLCSVVAVAVTITVVATVSAGAHSAPALGDRTAATEYLIGRGIADITGEAAEVGMMGYSAPQQQTQGIHQRVRARAFIVVDRASGRRVAIVNTDTGAMFQSVQQAVIRALHDRYGRMYTERNVLLSSTHSHAGPGGYSHYAAYNLSSLGFNPQTFQAIVDGTVEAIMRAHADLRPGAIVAGSGMLANASVNRSRAAFDRNPERGLFPAGIDPTMTVFGFRHEKRDIGAISWFSTHGTSMTNENRLISGDNKGYASYLWEHEARGVRYLDGHPGFVASFMQTADGDASPNLDLAPGSGPTKDPVANTRIIGERQAHAAMRIHAAATTAVTGGVDYRHMFVDMSAVTVSAEFTGDGRPHRTCPAAIGLSMLGGSHEDGPGLPLPEGISTPSWLSACQSPKPVAVPLGLMKPYPWVPEVLPVQLIRVGQFYLASVPAEVTVVAGYRIQHTIARVTGFPIDNVIPVGYANAYSQYVTTPEEYDAQQYEGASTLFGKWTLPAYQQLFARLARAMHDGQQVPSGPQPRDLSKEQVTGQPGVVFDAVPFGKSFGDVAVDAHSQYRRGATVSVSFWTGHPKNNVRRGETFLEIQRLTQGRWERVADDGDWSTRYEWSRIGAAYSQAKITWNISPDTPQGTYRIVHFGDWKDFWTGTIKPLVGCSRLFTVL